MTEVFDRNRGAAFDDADVARCYQFRPAYPAALYQAMLKLSPGRSAALDLGCGPGKLAGPLADHFARVDAIDPSAPMLAIAASTYPNAGIRWLAATAEDAAWDPPYDLVCAGASIHWMDHARLLPRLTESLSSGAWLMVVEGDGAWQPAWQRPWLEFMRRWLGEMGHWHDEVGHNAALNRYRDYLTIGGQREFESSVTQPLDEFIACQHSRASWARAVMGPARSARFDAELAELLAPYARDGDLHYSVRASLTWGRPGS